ncbi:hypothetical protein ALQ16_200943 [Pseudomonas syringae pv. actinidiae]|nr:hypothetical protein ALQ16_200943 [Pseudomonas syringae pv. actinidiae]
MKSQRQAAEHQAGDERQPLALFQLALLDVKNAVDHHRTDDEHGRCAEYATERVTVAEDIHGTRLGFVDDEKKEQRDEVDELFHNGSQKQDVAA